MLIRLCSHYLDNPAHIDKMICIKGLPEEFFFRPNQKYGGKELIVPWTPDVEANIPDSVRHLCDPFEVTKVFPPIEKGRDPIVDRLTVSAVRFDFMTEAGQTTWEKIERYLEKSVPRDQRVPKPVLVAPSQKSGFSPHEARRTTRGSLEMRPSEIPVIDLRPSVAELAPTPPVVIPEVDQPKFFTCEECSKSFASKVGLRMHKLNGHKKQKAVV